MTHMKLMSQSPSCAGVVPAVPRGESGGVLSGELVPPCLPGDHPGDFPRAVSACIRLDVDLSVDYFNHDCTRMKKTKSRIWP
jgi:hypothetical protein